MTRKQPFVTTVMYHYVRPVAGSAFPRLNALELDDFRGQLDHLQAHYNMISPSELLNDEPLPDRPCLLTFDDGYSDHYEHVFPTLTKRKLSGLFFPTRVSLIDRKMLEVNRIQFTLASHTDSEALADELDALLLEDGRFEPATLRDAHFSPNRYDSASVAYTKRLLQHVLPPEMRTTLTSILFRKHVSDDEAAFAESLYLTTEQAREMRASGMEFGGHGDSHLWHARASQNALAMEVAGSVAVLNKVCAPVRGGYYCYPFGDQNEGVREMVRDAGFHAGFTVVPELWSPDCDPMQISRLDTNDLPHAPCSGCPWLLKATEVEKA